MTGLDSTETTPHRRAPGGAGRTALPRGLLPLLALPLLLGACSSLFFDDEELAPQRIEVTGKQVEEPAYPNLASVPDQVPQPSPSAQRQEVAEGLSADRQHARYSDEPLTPESVAAEAAAASDPSYPPPPVLTAAEEGTTVSQTAASAPPPPGVPPEESPAALDEPAMPPPPAAAAPQATQAASQAVPEGGFTAPPPPSVTAAGETLAEAPDVPAPPSMSDPAIADSGMTASGDAGYGAPTGLLQERAFQQQAASAQRLQQIAAERRAFDMQARQRAIEQQMQGEQLIQQHQAQWRYPSAYQQLAAVPPAAGVYPAQQAYPAATAAPVAPGQLVGLIYFGHGSARLDARDRDVLQQVAALQRSQGFGLRVVGHASARTDAADMAQHEAKNQAMSMRRAQAVAEALVSLGADGGRIAVDGAGDAVPVYHEFTSTGEAGNRRVEIFLE